MDWPKSLLEVIRCYHVRHSSKLFEQAILESEYRCWADDCCFGEDTPDDLFASSLRSFSPQRHSLPAKLLTFVRKNSEAEFLLALWEDTWMKRSTSYFATASAMRSALSTWTSSRSKFLRSFSRCEIQQWNIGTSLDSLSPQDYRPRLNGARSPQSMGYSLDRIPTQFQ